MAELLKNKAHSLAMDLVRVQAQNDVFRMMGILQLSSEHDKVARDRVSHLNNYL